MNGSRASRLKAASRRVLPIGATGKRVSTPPPPRSFFRTIWTAIRTSHEKGLHVYRPAGGRRDRRRGCGGQHPVGTSARTLQGLRGNGAVRTDSTGSGRRRDSPASVGCAIGSRPVHTARGAPLDRRLTGAEGGRVSLRSADESGGSRGDAGAWRRLR